MLEFKPITKEDLSLIYPYLLKQQYRICDYTIGALYLWADYFSYQYCIYENTLFIRFKEFYDHQLFSYSLPIGQLPLDQSIELLLNYTGNNLVLSNVPKQAKQQLENYFSFEFTLQDGWADYLYLKDDLASFKGKKYNKKRNHLNQFLHKYSTFQYLPLTVELIPSAAIFLSTNTHLHDHYLSEYENKMVDQLIKDFHLLPLVGGLIIVESKIVALTIGSMIGDTLYIHVEKADREIEGSYTAIANFFARSSPENIVYINREEDVNDIGLRQSKLSYRPLYLLEKYNIFNLRRKF